MNAALGLYTLFPGTGDAVAVTTRRPGIAQYASARCTDAWRTVVTAQRCIVTAASTAPVRTRLSVAWQVVLWLWTRAMLLLGHLPTVCRAELVLWRLVRSALHRQYAGSYWCK